MSDILTKNQYPNNDLTRASSVATSCSFPSLGGKEEYTGLRHLLPQFVLTLTPVWR